MVLVSAAAGPPLAGISQEDREILSRIEMRRIALQSDNAQLRLRYEEILRWINPPWDPFSRRIDPRPEAATAQRAGEPKIHVDLVGQAVERWSALEMGAAPECRVVPKYVPPPDPSETDPTLVIENRKLYDIDRAIEQTRSTQMENITSEWMEEIAFHRTMYWTAWSKAAFGKAIIRDGWDAIEGVPTCELLENPSQVYYAWTKRYGRRKLGWLMVVDQMLPEEANFRYGLNIPIDAYGLVDQSSWTGVGDTSTEIDARPEQQESVNRYIFVEEYWELHRGGHPAQVIDEYGEPIDSWNSEEQVLSVFAVAGRVVEKTWHPFKSLPFHVFEDAHVLTFNHGRSMAERLIPINAAYDDMLDRQQQVIDFAAGPRYKGLNMGSSGDEIDMPDAFELLPLREGEDIAQIDMRVDFFPTQIHAEELREAKYHSTGLTPIAWGMSPNAQTSGRALSAEWRAVELPLHGKIINAAPEIRDIWINWWDYAERAKPEYREIAKGWRRFEAVFEPLDIRDSTERTLDVIQRLQANILDPELAMEQTGIHNTDEVMARIRAYLLDPVYNPLRYQQYLILQQLEIQIRQAALELMMQEAQLGVGGGELAPGGPAGTAGVAALAAQGQNAAGQAAQGPAGPVTEAQNQPGQSPAGGGLPVDTSILARTPMEGGIGNQAVVPLEGGGPAPTGGNQPR